MNLDIAYVSEPGERANNEDCVDIIPLQILVRAQFCAMGLADMLMESWLQPVFVLVSGNIFKQSPILKIFTSLSMI